MNVKTIFLILLCVITFVSGTNKVVYRHSIRTEYKGNVKYLKHRTFDGRFVDSIVVKKDSNPLQEGALFFNEKGLLIEEKVASNDWFSPYNTNFGESDRAVFVYDEEGYKTEEIWYEYKNNGQERILQRRKFSYDKKGNEISVIIFDWQDSIEFRTENTFDRKRNLIEKRGFDNNSKLYKYILYKYDQKGRLVESSETEYEYSRRKIYIYKYDKQGREVEFAELDTNTKIVQRQVYTYNEKGLKIEARLIGVNDTLNTQIILTYDSLDNLIRKVRYNHKGDITSKDFYTYKYDQKGNWIFCTVVYQNNYNYYNSDCYVNKKAFVYEREFEYYD